MTMTSSFLPSLKTLSDLHARATQDDLDIVKELVPQYRILGRGQFAVLALLVYDIIITMDKEINYFWTRSFSPTKLAFCLIRYAPVFRTSLWILGWSLDVSNTICNLTLWGGNITDWLILTCIDYALYLRIRALYSLEFKDKKVVRYTTVLFVLGSTVTLSILIHAAITQHVSALAVLGFSYCVAMQAPSIAEYSVLWAVILSYQVILVLLTVLKAIRLQRTLGMRGVRLLRVIVQNQLTYASIVPIFGILNLVLTYVENGATSTSVSVLYNIAGNTGLLSLVGSRMLIQLKQASEQNTREGGSLRLPTRASTDVLRSVSTRPESVPGQLQDTVQRTSEHGG